MLNFVDRGVGEVVMEGSDGCVCNCWEGSCGVSTSDETGERTSDSVSVVCDRWWERSCGETGERMGTRGLGGCLDSVVQESLVGIS